MIDLFCLYFQLAIDPAYVCPALEGGGCTYQEGHTRQEWMETLCSKTEGTEEGRP